MGSEGSVRIKQSYLLSKNKAGGYIISEIVYPAPKLGSVKFMVPSGRQLE